MIVLKHSQIKKPLPGQKSLTINFITPDSQIHKISCLEGSNLLDIAHANNIDLEGACEGSLACSTCHLIITDKKFYNSIPEPSDEENDMLDLAFGLTETSRLGCQVEMTPELDGMTVRIPSATRNVSQSKL